jgi:hypothetical protein
MLMMFVSMHVGTSYTIRGKLVGAQAALGASERVSLLNLKLRCIRRDARGRLAPTSLPMVPVASYSHR